MQTHRGGAALGVKPTDKVEFESWAFEDESRTAAPISRESPGVSPF